MKNEKDHGGTRLTEGDAVSVSVLADAASHAVPWLASNRGPLSTHNHPTRFWERDIHTAYSLDLVATAHGASMEEARSLANAISALPELLQYALMQRVIDDFECPHDSETRCVCVGRHAALCDAAESLRERAIAKAEGK